MWLNLKRTVDKRGRTARKVITLQTTMTKKARQFFFQEKIGATQSVAAPGDTNPSGATVSRVIPHQLWQYNMSPTRGDHRRHLQDCSFEAQDFVALRKYLIELKLFCLLKIPPPRGCTEFPGVFHVRRNPRVLQEVCGHPVLRCV